MNAPQTPSTTENASSQPLDLPGQIDKALQAMRGASSLVIISHMNPDPDALGSQLGLALALREALPTSVTIRVFNESPLPHSLNFIPGYSLLEGGLEDLERCQLGESGVVTVMVDCGDMKRVGDTFLPVVQSASCLVNIDHHISNDFFGHVAVVEATASSTSEIIYELLERGKITPTSETATCLFTGISGDTGSFKYSSTSARTLEIASKLVERGASPALVAEKLYGTVRRESVKLHAAVLMNATFLCDGKVAFGVVGEKEYQASGGTPDDAEGLVEKLRDIEGVKVAALAKFDGDIWRVSLRSRGPEWNVSTLAQSFGGGGHIMAAAFRWRQSWQELDELLRTRLQQLLQSS